MGVALRACDAPMLPAVVYEMHYVAVSWQGGG